MFYKNKFILTLLFMLCTAFGVHAQNELPSCDESIDLIAAGGDGIGIDIGDITISADASGNLTITIDSSGDSGNWYLGKVHVQVINLSNGEDFRLVTTRKGLPKPGKFEYFEDGFETTQQIVLRALPEGVDPRDEISVAVHAEVVERDGRGGIPRAEAAWGKGTEFVEKRNWAMHHSCDILITPIAVCPVECKQVVDSGLQFLANNLNPNSISNLFRFCIFNNFNPPVLESVISAVLEIGAVLKVDALSTASLEPPYGINCDFLSEGPKFSFTIPVQTGVAPQVINACSRYFDQKTQLILGIGLNCP